MITLEPTTLFILGVFGSIKLVKAVRDSLTVNYAVTLTRDAERFHNEET